MHWVVRMRWYRTRGGLYTLALGGVLLGRALLPSLLGLELMGRWVLGQSRWVWGEGFGPEVVTVESL